MTKREHQDAERLHAPARFANEFLRPRLIGARFEHGSIPLEILSDLAALGALVIEVAKWRYLERNPRRKRIPSGFANGVDFRIAGIEDGSTIPVIVMVEDLSPSRGGRRFPEMADPGFGEYFHEALGWIAQAISAAEAGDGAEIALPEKGLRMFSRIGRNLRADEVMEIPVQGRSPARLTRESRRSLLRASRVEEIIEETSVRAYVPEIDQDRMTFSLELLQGGRVPARFHDTYRDTIMKVFNNYREREHARILVLGSGMFDQRGRLRSLESITQVTVLHPLDTPSCLYELRRLEDGWLDGEGLAPDPDSLIWLSERFESLYPSSLPRPYIYPTPEGGVQAEWSLPPYEVSLTVDFATHGAVWHSLGLETEDEDERFLTLADPAAWEWIARSIQSLSRDSG